MWFSRSEESQEGDENCFLSLFIRNDVCSCIDKIIDLLYYGYTFLGSNEEACYENNIILTLWRRVTTVTILIHTMVYYIYYQ